MSTFRGNLTDYEQGHPDVIRRFTHDDETRANAGHALVNDVVVLPSDNAHYWRQYTTVTEHTLPRANRHNTSDEIAVRRTVNVPTSDLPTHKAMRASRRNGKCITRPL